MKFCIKKNYSHFGIVRLLLLNQKKMNQNEDKISKRNIRENRSHLMETYSSYMKFWLYCKNISFAINPFGTISQTLWLEQRKWIVYSSKANFSVWIQCFNWHHSKIQQQKNALQTKHEIWSRWKNEQLFTNLMNI